jgi:hypothetical protein
MTRRNKNYRCYYKNYVKQVFHHIFNNLKEEDFIKLDKLDGIEIINNFLKSDNVEKTRRAAAIICNVSSGKNFF